MWVMLCTTSGFYSSYDIVRIWSLRSRRKKHLNFSQRRKLKKYNNFADVIYMDKEKDKFFFM